MKADETTLLGVYFTVASIIIVYHLFSLQAWSQVAVQLDAEANAIDTATAMGDFLRARAKSRCSAHRAGFPWSQVAVLGVAVGGLGTAAVVVALDLQSISRWLTISPVGVLGFVFVFATATTFADGSQRLRNAMRLLG